MKTYITLLVLTISLSLFGQEDDLKLRPYLINGIDFIQSDSLENIYGTKSKIFFGGGIEYRVSDLNKIRFMTQFTYSSFSVNVADSLVNRLTTNKILIGFVFPLYTKDKITLVTNIGASFSRINETNYKINNSRNIGLQIGLGLEKRMVQTVRIFMNLTYQYQKLTLNYSFRNFDMLKLSFGLKF